MQRSLAARGWNLFGSAGIFACYFASDNPSLYLFLGIIIVAAVHLAWRYTVLLGDTLKVQDFYRKILMAWHFFASNVLDMNLFFVFSQSFSRRRSSVMHVPSELSYIPMVYAATFVVPKIYRSSSSLLNATEEEGRWSLCCGLLALTNAAAFVLCTCDPCTGGPDLTSSLSQPLKISTFCVLAVIYSLPVFPAAPSSTTPKNLPVVLGLAKAAVLFAGILLFSRKTDCGEPDDSNQIYYYDFYSLRVLSQSDHHHYWGNFRAIFLRLSPLLSSCWWFTHHWKVPSASIDAHELRTAFTFASIILGVLSVASRAHLSPDEHSSGILVSQAAIKVLTVVASVLLQNRAAIT